MLHLVSSAVLTLEDGEIQLLCPGQAVSLTYYLKSLKTASTTLIKQCSAPGTGFRTLPPRVAIFILWFSEFMESQKVKCSYKIAIKPGCPLSAGIRLNTFCFYTSKSSRLLERPAFDFWVRSVITPACSYIDGKRLSVSKHQSLITSCFKEPRSPRSHMLMQFNLYTHPCWFHQAAKHPGCNLIMMQRQIESISQRWHLKTWNSERASIISP